MANASSKRIAQANEGALKGLVRNLVLINALALAVRWMKARHYVRPLIPGGFVLFLHVVGIGASVAIWRWFAAIGTPGRDAKGNVRVGEDLSGGGFIELAWDVIYMTWICTLGSALFGNWVWWFYLVIPAFGAYKLFTFAQPFLGMFLPGIFGPRQPRAEGDAPAAAADEPAESKRQAKLRARMEKGDKRIQQKQVRAAR
ncbi:hypothetical protein Q8F55_001919 [Vanrija albida]|uniref:Uncharacterized protein n=1 Tax=Vanrija albida TaxID=181172 RepID=A0ABR3Q8G9_9TREE